MAMKLMQDKQVQKLVGRTIKKVGNSSVNGMTIEFTDGTAIWVECEPDGGGIYQPTCYEIDPKIPVHKQ